MACASLALLLVIWFSPVPAGLSPRAWHLFALFVSAIFSVIVGALPILTASVLAVGAAVLSGTLAAEKAYSGFANGTILLIVVAFLVARAVVKSGLGQRLGYLVVSLFGKSTLGLSYSIFLLDAAIAPAFPSNTARSGVLYPIIYSLAQTSGSRPEDGTQKRVGSFLMFSGMASLTLSSGLWLTAMAGNPLGAEVAKSFGTRITFGSWFIGALVPTAVAMILLPLVLYKLFPPEVKATPEAPEAARKALREMGSLTAQEWWVAGTFISMVVLWALAGSLKLDSTAVAFVGLGVLLAADVLTLKDIAKEGDVLATFIWFAVLYTLSGQLNELGFMGFVGQRIARELGGLPWLSVLVVLVVLYVLMHYFFVSQSAQVLALLGVFLDVGTKVGVPAAPLAFALLFASNYFSSLTPQGSSANVIFAGSGYLTQGELYKLGALTTSFNLLVFLVVGTPWLLLVAR
ncbi:MAG: DASS family sodium-coupled anion symporter [Acidobacteriota bacterium]